MSEDTRPSYLQSASALIKSLRAASDPPEQGGPSKAQIGLEAWAAKDFHVPRKAEVLRDWVLESWTKAKPSDKQSTLTSPDYHRLLLQIGLDGESPTAPPLQILSNFFTSLLKNDDSTIFPIAAQSFASLFDTQDVAYKADNWVEVWVNLLKFMSARKEGDEESTKALGEIVDIVVAGVKHSQPSSTNNTQTVITAFPSYSTAYLNYPSLRPRLTDTLSHLIFHHSTLQTSEPLRPLFAAIEPSLSKPDVAQGALLSLPPLFQSLISIYHTHRFSLFTQASSSKVPHDVFVSSKERDAVRSALEKTSAFFDGAEAQHLQVEPKGKPHWAGRTWIWQSRVGVWQAVAAWGGYMEREDAWSRLADGAARRAEGALSTFANDGSAEATAYLGSVLQTLATLEKLDHDQARIGPDVVRWCLAAPVAHHPIATTILSSLLRFHQLTHSIPAFFTLLSASLSGLFSASLPDAVIHSLYQLTIPGPLIARPFREELIAALHAGNPGQRRGVVWNNVFGGLATSLRGLAVPEAGGVTEGNSKKRKRAEGDAEGALSASSAAMVGVQSRLLAYCLDAAADTTYDGEPEKDALAAFLPFLEEWSSAVPEVSSTPAGKGKKTAAGKAEGRGAWSAAVDGAGRLRVVRSVEKLLRRRCAPEEELAGLLLNRASPVELQVELVRFMLHRAALELQISLEPPASFSADLDAILSLLGSSTGSEKEAFWQIVTQQGLAIIDLVASPEQIARLAELCNAALTESAAVRRLFAAADIWELPKLRGALQEVITSKSTAKSSPQIINLLDSCPPSYLGRKARTTAVDAVYGEADLSSALEWLNRMASESDNLGPLTQDPDVLIRLAKLAGKQSSEERSPALSLWKRAISHISRSPAQNEALLSKTLEYYLKTIKKVRKGKAGSAESDVQAIAVFCQEVMGHSFENFPAPVQAQMKELAESMVSYLRPLLLADDVEKHQGSIQAWNIALRFSSWLGEPVKQETPVGQRICTSLLKTAKSQGLSGDEFSKLAKPALELLGNEDGSVEQLLGVVVLFYHSFPDVQLDEAVRESFKNRVEQGVSTCMELASLKGPQQRAVLSVLRVLAGSCSKPELVRQALEVGVMYSPEDGVEAAKFIESIVEDKATVIQGDGLFLILSKLLYLLSLPLTPSTFTSIVNILTIINRRRPELLLGSLPQVVEVIGAVFIALQTPRSVIAALALNGGLDAGDRLDEKHAQLFSRLLIAMTQARPSKNKHSQSLNQETSPLAKHIPALLVSYVRTSADPLAGFTTAVRRELEPGLFALCNLATVGGRANARGREGEGLGVPFGLGEGPSGEGEKELWAELWRGWSKARYTGQG
ncbi:hypothetical protein IAT38_008141 [Cryptococcus sp. DSM 104549]